MQALKVIDELLTTMSSADTNGKTDSKRVINFSAGPSVLPESVLQECQRDLLSWQGCGQSVMEMSHRSKQFTLIYNEAEANLRELAAVPDNFHIFMLQGGATMQFSSIPLNFNISENPIPPQYIITGGWSDKAFKEALKYKSNTQQLFNTMTSNPPCTSVPDFDADDMKINENAPYLYVCVNETVHGVMMHNLPKTQKVPLIADYSSCFMSEPIPWNDVNFGVVYGGAQKNIGPAGLTIAFVRDDLIGKADKRCPVLLDYATWRKKPIYNTPPCWSIYVMGLCMKWIKNEIGGMDEMKDRNVKKAKVIYDVIEEEENKDFYVCAVDKNCRSLMNVRFRIKDDAESEKKFIAEAEKLDMINLKGHRSLGGCRASLYNAQSIDNCQKLAKFMREFRQQNE